MFKCLVLTFTIFLFAGNSFAAKVRSARMDQSNTHILIDVTYAGGCSEHKFALKLDDHCLESSPVQCTAELVESTNDGCEALIGETISISLEEAGLNDPYFAGASLTILGDLDWQTNKPSSVQVTLP